MTPAAHDLMALANVEGAAVPALWLTEIGNVLLVNERRGRLTERQSAAFLPALSFLTITVDPARADAAFERTLPLARREKITTYDASYLELAIRLRLPMATRDVRLRDAASRNGVQFLDV